MLSFTDTFSKKVAETPIEAVSTMHLTNSVSHSNSQAVLGAAPRVDFWGQPVPAPVPSAMLRLVTNDEASAANFRIDSTAGRLLSFTEHGNHIRAGSHSPCDAVLSIYQFYDEVLTGPGLVYPMHITVPNIVACGEFKDPLSSAFDKNGLVSSSDKFPGYAIALNTGATPVVYPGKAKTNKRFIVPGITSVEQALDTVHRMHAITHSSETSQLPKKVDSTRTVRHPTNSELQTVFGLNV